MRQIVTTLSATAGRLTLLLGVLMNRSSVNAQSAQGIHYHVVSDRSVGSGALGSLAIDPSHRTLYGIGNTVIDLTNDSVVGTLPAALGHGFAFATDLGRGISRNGAIFDLKTLAELTPTGPSHASAVVYDQLTKRAARNDVPLEIIDVSTGNAVSHLPLGPSHAIVADNDGHFFTALDADSLVVVDARRLVATRRGSLDSCHAARGMAIDRVAHRLLVSCANERLLVVNSANGKVIAVVPVAHATGQLAFDTTLRVLFLLTDAATVTVVKEIAPDTYRIIDNVAVGHVPLTVAVDQSTHRVYLAYFGNTTTDAEAIFLTALEASQTAAALH